MKHGNFNVLIGIFITEMQDFSLLSSKTVTEVLMLEMKMAPTAKTYLVSGYPRNMRDVVEYSERVSEFTCVMIRLSLFYFIAVQPKIKKIHCFLQ